MEIVEASRSTGEIGSRRRRSDGVCGVVGLPRHDRAQPRRDVGVVVEPEHRVGLGQRLGEVLAVALGQAADRDDGLGASAVSGGGLEVGRLEQRVDGVLLGRLDEAAGVDHDRVGVLGVGDQHEAAGLEPPGQLLGVDLVAGAAEGHHSDVQRGRGAARCQSSSLSSMPVPRPGGAIRGLSGSPDPGKLARPRPAISVDDVRPLARRRRARRRPSRHHRPAPR